MEDQKIRFDENSRDLLRSCMDKLQNDTIKVLAENIQGATGYNKLTTSVNFCKAFGDVQTA